MENYSRYRCFLSTSFTTKRISIITKLGRCHPSTLHVTPEDFASNMATGTHLLKRTLWLDTHDFLNSHLRKLEVVFGKTEDR
jgi:hypothetical protein